MYTEKLPETLYTTTLVKIKYDCCNKEHILKWKDADKNFQKNNNKHICRSCWLTSDSNPAKKQESKDKAKQTCLEKYGTTLPINTPEQIEKRRQKFQDKEWVEQGNEKRKQTNLERLGVEFPSQSKEVQEKFKESVREKWGVDHPLQNEEIKKKVKLTNLEKYGVENPAQISQVRDKMYSTTEERYGVKHYNQLPEMRKWMSEHCKEWLSESWANPWAKGITRPEEWNEKQRETIDKLISEGKWKGGGNTYHGWYSTKKCLKSKVYWKSSYELISLIHLDVNENVEFYDYEPFQTEYYDTEGKKRHFTVDLIIKYKNNAKLVAVEVKNNYTNEQSLNKQKYKYFLESCRKNNIEFEIWTNDKIKSFNYDLEECLKNENVQVMKSPSK